MTGNLNANIADLEGTPRGESIAEEIVAAGIENMGMHFLPRRNPWLHDKCKWSMRRDEREVRYWTDYILGTDHRLLQDVAVRDP